MTTIEADVRRERGNRLLLHYVLHGNIKRILLPPPAAPYRRDGLWQHSCFEAFVGTVGDSSYREFNFSPSSAWAAYYFRRYRRNMTRVEPFDTPAITVQYHEEFVEMQVRMKLPFATALPLRIALAAVIEETNGQRSYWALRHPRARPDFHHGGGFSLHMPASRTARQVEQQP